MGELVLCDEHAQVYDMWRHTRQTGLRISHVDFHCDMRGLLIDRGRQRASLVNPADPALHPVDSGNYLTHAIMDGTVRAVRWIHDPHGGRRYDVGTVKYSTDPSARLSRLLRRRNPGPEVPLAFEELTFDQWNGDLTGHQLDLDWDAIASTHYAPAKIRALMESFLDRNFAGRPDATYLVFSPGYANPDRALYEEFAARLASKFQAALTRLPPPEPEPSKTFSWNVRLGYKLTHKLHRIGIRRVW